MHSTHPLPALSGFDVEHLTGTKNHPIRLPLDGVCGADSQHGGLQLSADRVRPALDLRQAPESRVLGQRVGAVDHRCLDLIERDRLPPVRQVAKIAEGDLVHRQHGRDGVGERLRAGEYVGPLAGHVEQFRDLGDAYKVTTADRHTARLRRTR